MSAATYDYHLVDVFTDRPYAGNPLAVVLDADGLSTAQMQAIALEFNLSETTFVLPPTTAEATYRVRIFTPRSELPFAGHPSVGTAWLLGHLGRYEPGEVIQECGAGLLPVTVGADGARLVGGPITQSDPIDAGDFLAALGLTADDHAGTPARWCGCGIDWGYLRVRPDALGRIRLDLSRLAGLGRSGVCAFAWADGAARARVYAADLGVPEDPATGSAALGLGVFLVASGLLPGEGSSAYEVVQGVEMGRPSRLAGTVGAEGGRAVEATVAGGVVPVGAGRITPPPE